HFTRRLTGYSLVMFLKDTVPFALIALSVMVATHFLTISIENLWLLFLARVAMAAILYFAILKMAHAKILDECVQFVRKRYFQQK
ncbi:MAG: lipopolysaccharide biosynthesis protein, partial [Prevotella sp.]|nr:lipopolysaccharide biosynthesis protein [Prevotella sp.]